ALSYCIVPAIRLPAHALKHLVFYNYRPEFITSILDPSIRMEDKPLFDTSAPNGHLDGFYRSIFSSHISTQRPSDNFSISQIDDRCQIQPPFAGMDICNIA